MNTEFPSRIPTVVNNKRSSSSSSQTTIKVADSDETKSFQNIAKEAFKSLNNLMEKANDAVLKFFDFYKEKAKKDDSDKRKAKTSSDDMKADIKSKSDNGDDDKKSFRDLIFNQLNAIWSTVKKGFEKVSLKNTSGIQALQRSIESTNASVGNAIGNVFGGGLFSKLISGAITKALNFAVSKVLVGMVLSNLPMILLVGGIIAAIGTLIYFAEDIWNAIKWLGWAIDQGVDAIIDVLPWGKSKYEEARKNLGEALNVDEETIKALYGDTIRGRNQAYEDWKALESGELSIEDFEDLAFAASLLEDAATDLSKAAKAPTTSSAQSVVNTVNNTYNNGPMGETVIPYVEEDDARGMSLVPNVIVNNVNSNNTTAASYNNIMSALSNMVYNSGQPAGSGYGYSSSWTGQ